MLKYAEFVPPTASQVVAEWFCICQLLHQKKIQTKNLAHRRDR